MPRNNHAIIGICASVSKTRRKKVAHVKKMLTILERTIVSEPWGTTSWLNIYAKRKTTEREREVPRSECKKLLVGMHLLSVGQEEQENAGLDNVNDSESNRLMMFYSCILWHSPTRNVSLINSADARKQRGF